MQGAADNVLWPLFIEKNQFGFILNNPCNTRHRA